MLRFKLKRALKKMSRTRILIYCTLFLILGISSVSLLKMYALSFSSRNIITGLAGNSVTSTTVTIDDFENDYNYYMGLNYTTIKNGYSVTSGTNFNLYNDDNLVKVTVNYHGTNIKGNVTGHVSGSERQTDFVYKKVYPIVNEFGKSYIAIELLDNPYSEFPVVDGTVYAFAGWTINNITDNDNDDFSEAFTKMDIDTNVTTLYIPVKSTKQADLNVELNAGWVWAEKHDVAVNAFTPNAFADFKEYGFDEYDVNNFLAKDENGGYAHDENGYYYFNDGDETYLQFDGLYIRIYNLTEDQKRYSYNDKGVACDISNDCWHTAYKKLEPDDLNTHEKLTNYVNSNGGLKFYRFNNRDTNVALLVSGTDVFGRTVNNNDMSVLKNITKPLTLTTSLAGQVNTNIYFDVAVNTTLNADLNINNVTFNFAGRNINANTNSAYETSINQNNNGSIIANYHNLKLGRNIVSKTASNPTMRGVFAGNGTNNTTYMNKSRVIIETGIYNYYVAGSTTKSTSTLQTVTAVLGSDYDRASNNNSKLNFRWCVIGSFHDNNYNEGSDPVSTMIVKSGLYGYGYNWTKENQYHTSSAARYGMYVGGRNNGVQTGYYIAIQEGGEINHVNGGPSTVKDITGTYTGFYLKSGVTEYVFGGAAISATARDRVVSITGGTVTGNVFGGSNSFDGSGEDGKLTGSTLIYIGGNANIGYAGLDTTKETYFNAAPGCVFGAGDGNAEDKGGKMGSVNSARIIFEGNAHVYGSVYGGGNYGSTGKMNISGTETVMNFNGGTIDGNVYGSSKKNGSGLVGKVTINENASSVIYYNTYDWMEEGGLIPDHMKGYHTSNTADNNSVNDERDFDTYLYNDTPVPKGGITCTETTPGFDTNRRRCIYLYGIIKAGSDLTYWKEVAGPYAAPFWIYDHHSEVVDNQGNIKFYVQNDPDHAVGVEELNWFIRNDQGESYGNEAHTVNVNVNGVHVKGSVYGGSDTGGTVFANVYVNLLAGKVDNDVFGAGKGKDTFVSGDVTVNTYSLFEGTNVYGGSEYGTVNSSGEEYNDTKERSVTVNINGGSIENVFGGSKGSADIVPELFGAINVYIKDGNGVTNVYGGNDENGHAQKNATVYINGGNTENVYGGSRKADFDVTKVYVNGGTATNVYGGSNISGTVRVANVFALSGVTENIYGGNNSGGTATTTYVVLNGGSIGNAYACGYGSQTICDSTFILVNGINSTSGAVYGGGYASKNNSPTNVVVNKGTIGDVYGGNNNSGVIDESNVYINNGTVNRVFGGNNLGGKTTNTNVIVGNGTIDQVFGGSNGIDTYATTTNVHIYGGTITDVFGGGNESGADQTNVNAYGGTITNTFGGSNNNGNVSATNVNIGDDAKLEQKDLSLLYSGGSTDLPPGDGEDSKEEEEEDNRPCVIKNITYQDHTVDFSKLDQGDKSYTYSEKHNIDFFDFIATANNDYTIGSYFVKLAGGYRNDFGRTIKFKTEGTGNVTLTAISTGTNNRTLVLLDSKGGLTGQSCDVQNRNAGYTDCSFSIPKAGTYYIGSTSGSLNIINLKARVQHIERDTSACDEEEVKFTEVAVEHSDTLLAVNAYWNNVGVFGYAGNTSPNSTVKAEGTWEYKFGIGSNPNPVSYEGTDYYFYMKLYNDYDKNYLGSSSISFNIPKDVSEPAVKFLASSLTDADGVIQFNSYRNEWVTVEGVETVTSKYYDSVTYYLSDEDNNLVASKTITFDSNTPVYEVVFSGLTAGKKYYLTESNPSNIYSASTYYVTYEEKAVEVDGPISVDEYGHVINWSKVIVKPELSWAGGANSYNNANYVNAIQGQTVIDRENKTPAEVETELNALKKKIQTYVSTTTVRFHVENPYPYPIEKFRLKFYSKDVYIDLLKMGGTPIGDSNVNTFDLYTVETEPNYYLSTQDKTYTYDTPTFVIPANYSGYLGNGQFILYGKNKPINISVVANWDQIWNYIPGTDAGGSGSGVGGTSNVVDSTFDSTIYEATNLKTTNVYGGNNNGGETSSANVNLYKNSVTENSYGGGNNAITTTTNVNANGGINIKVYGGGRNASVSENSTVEIYGGVQHYVYGGREKGDILGNSTVNLLGGTVVRALFGSGNEANTGSASNHTTSTVNLAGGLVQGDVYGGAYSKVVYGYTNVNVGASTVLATIRDKATIKSLQIDGNIYSGGQTGTDGSEKMSFDFVSVTDGSVLNLDPTLNTDFEVHQSIFGSGNNSVVKDTLNGNAVVNIKNLGKEDNIYTIESIQRADTVNLENNYLQITGAEDSTSTIKSTRKLLFSYNRIVSLHMINQNELYLANGANMLMNLYSEYRDENDNLVKESVDIDVEKDEENQPVLVDGIVKNNTVSKTNGQNEIYMARTKVLNVWLNETGGSSSEGNVYGMAFLGMYEYNESDNTVNKGIYDDYEPKEVVSDDVFEDFRYSGTYVYGKHYLSHDITVDGFYTNYIDDVDAKGIRVDYINPTPDNSTYYMWTIGMVSSKFDVELHASKYSTLGAAILPLNTFENPDAEFWVASVQTAGLQEGINLTNKESVAKVASTTKIANTTIGLSMDTGNAALNGWKGTSETDFMAVNKYTGDDKYDADSTTSTPTLSFYLHHSKNVEYEEADNSGDLGYVVIYLESRIPDPNDPTKYDVRNIEITVYMSIIEDSEDGYGSAITPGKKYSVFPSTLTNITYNSSFSIYQSLYIDMVNKEYKINASFNEETSSYSCPVGYELVTFEPSEGDEEAPKPKCSRPFVLDDLYPEGAYRQLASKMLFPVGTTISMIDLATNTYYYYVVDNEDFVKQQAEYNSNNEVTYYLRDFYEMSSINYVGGFKRYQDQEHNLIYHHTEDGKDYAFEEFIFTVDFGNVDHEKIDMRQYIVSNASFYMELMSPETVNGKNKQIMLPVSDNLGDMLYNIYYTDFNGIQTVSEFDKKTVYADQITTLNVNTTVSKQYNDITVNNTAYDEYKLGAKITVYDETGNLIDGSTLLGMTLSIGGVKYNPSIDGSFRVRLADNVTTVNSPITVDVGNSNLTTGRYKFVIETFGSFDGIYNKSGEATNITEAELYVVNNKFGLEITIPDVSVTHDSGTGKDEKENSVIEYNLKTSSGLADPNLRISLQRRIYSTEYNLNYELVDVADYVRDRDALQTTTITKQYLVPNAFYNAEVDGENYEEIKTKELTYELDLGDNLKSGTYKVVFSVYDGDQYIGENYAYLIIRDIWYNE